MNLADITSDYALKYIHNKMNNNPIGKNILLKKPLINEESLNVNYLRSLSHGNKYFLYIK